MGLHTTHLAALSGAARYLRVCACNLGMDTQELLTDMIWAIHSVALVAQGCDPEHPLPEHLRPSADPFDPRGNEGHGGMHSVQRALARDRQGCGVLHIAIVSATQQT